MNQTMTDSELEELLEHTIPCNVCGKPAQLRSMAHGCGLPAPDYGCIACWTIWYRNMLRKLTSVGFLCCICCHHEFDTVEAFADYREF